MGNHVVKNINLDNYPDRSFIVMAFLPQNRTKNNIIEWLETCFVDNGCRKEIIAEIKKEEVILNNIRYVYSEKNKIMHIHILLGNCHNRRIITKMITSASIKKDLEIPQQPEIDISKHIV